MATELPPTHHALVLRSRTERAKIETLPTPQPVLGSCVVRVHYSGVVPYANEIFEGKRPYPLPLPLVPGLAAIGRVTATGPDCTALKPGQLVYVDGFIAGRDDPDVLFLFGSHQGDSDGSARLMAEVWRDGCCAEYVRAPLENVYALDENRLLKELGYSMRDLVFMSTQLIPFGGLDDIDLRAGERVVIAPATGWFGGAAVMCALAMGARVIAAGRNVTALEDIKARMGNAYDPRRIETVQLSGDVEKDTAAFKAFGPVDAFFEISPPVATNATYIHSAIKALRRGGRVSLMGGLREDVKIPFRHVMHSNIRIHGKWMYDRGAVFRFLKMVEGGALKLGAEGGVEVVGEWPLEEWSAAFKAAEENSRLGKVAIIKSI